MQGKDARLRWRGRRDQTYKGIECRERRESNMWYDGELDDKSVVETRKLKTGMRMIKLKISK
jgi:hypothetical protein